MFAGLANLVQKKDKEKKEQLNISTAAVVAAAPPVQSVPQESASDRQVGAKSSLERHQEEVEDNVERNTKRHRQEQEPLVEEEGLKKADEAVDVKSKWLQWEESDTAHHLALKELLAKAAIVEKDAKKTPTTESGSGEGAITAGGASDETPTPTTALASSSCTMEQYCLHWIEYLTLCWRRDLAGKRAALSSEDMAGSAASAKDQQMYHRYTRGLKPLIEELEASNQQANAETETKAAVAGGADSSTSAANKKSSSGGKPAVKTMLAPPPKPGRGVVVSNGNGSSSFGVGGPSGVERRLDTNILESLYHIFRAVEQRHYLKAEDAYFQLSIGNDPWHLGVFGGGIHQRKSLDRIQRGKLKFLMNDPVIREYLHGIKTLIAVSQRLYPSKKNNM